MVYATALLASSSIYAMLTPLDRGGRRTTLAIHQPAVYSAHNYRAPCDDDRRHLRQPTARTTCLTPYTCAFTRFFRRLFTTCADGRTTMDDRAITTLTAGFMRGHALWPAAFLPDFYYGTV